jgi:type III pantothenate kinase
MLNGARLVAVNIGNSAIALSPVEGVEPQNMQRFLHADLQAAVDAIVQAAADERSPCAGVVIASVNPPMREKLVDLIIPRLDTELYQIGDDVVIPIAHTLTDAAFARTGQDRLLNALAAHRMSQAAAMVVDAGSAITVDFVDGEGTAVIATGGDAGLLFEGDPIVERIVPDLTLRGIAFACRQALSDDNDQ